MFLWPTVYIGWLPIVNFYRLPVHAKWLAFCCLIPANDRECVDLLDSGNVKNSTKKFTAAKLLRRRDVFYKNLLTILKAYHRVCAQHVFWIIYHSCICMVSNYDTGIYYVRCIQVVQILPVFIAVELRWLGNRNGISSVRNFQTTAKVFVFLGGRQSNLE